MLNRFENHNFMYQHQPNHECSTGFKITISYITCSQIMHAEQVLKSRFNIGITRSQNMNDEQVLISQFSIDITCSQTMHAEQDLQS